MSPIKTAPKVLSWATDVEDNTLAQAAMSSTLPFVEGHVALMSDAHLGFGATVGSVIPTRGAIIPAAVGVDIGCGMAAVCTELGASDLPDTLEPLLGRIGTVSWPAKRGTLTTLANSSTNIPIRTRTSIKSSPIQWIWSR